MKESDIQAAIVEYIHLCKLSDYLIYIPNEQIIFASKDKKKWGWWKKLLKMGYKKGTSDLFLALPRGDKHGLWLEVKKPKKRPTEDQKKFMKLMIGKGYEAKVVHSVDEAIVAIYLYMKNGIG